jgi:hypothetical protein
MNKFKLKLFSLLLFCIGNCLKAVEVESTNGTPKAIPGKLSFAFGMQRYTSVTGLDLFTDNTFHGMIEFSQGYWLGFGFGMDRNFKKALLETDLRMNLVTYKNSSLFVNIMAGYKRWGYSLLNVGSGNVIYSNGKNSFSGAFLMGFDFPIVESRLRASVAYGMHFLTGLKDNNVGITNNDFAGNFGIHWYF